MKLDTHTDDPNVFLMSDGNDSTCFSLSTENTTQVLGDLQITTDLTANRTILIEILMRNMDCNNTIAFYRTASNGCGTRPKVVKEIGEVIPAVPNNSKCYHRLSVECGNITTGYEMCQFEAQIAVTTRAGLEMEICDLHQG